MWTQLIERTTTMHTKLRNNESAIAGILTEAGVWHTKSAIKRVVKLVEAVCTCQSKTIFTYQSVDTEKGSCHHGTGKRGDGKPGIS